MSDVSLEMSSALSTEATGSRSVTAVDGPAFRGEDVAVSLLVDEPADSVSAAAVHGAAKSMTPTPSAAASPPTRPIQSAAERGDLCDVAAADPKTCPTLCVFIRTPDSPKKQTRQRAPGTGRLCGSVEY
ncbi:hypothetical protein MDUV_06630 [Mycolicibacterium duvalii]|uniref:Uncharacterized protein n=1 Tax=Mycolicibacterium duvalii TaxID=39688 RepID=A0A7I7JVH7_9MYCO|nr:hypothetical protein MDUV_06630 [Mycolicibacterium duvalii]